MDATEIKTRRKLDPKMNSIKEKMSLAYMYGINSTVNYAFSETNKDFDGLGMDLRIRNKLIGEGRSVASESNEINMQLKGVSISSHSMFSEDDTSIKYKLSKSLQPYGTHFLVVVVLPEECELASWREISEDVLTLRARAYYLHIPKTLAAGNVIIPKANILTHESYINLFLVAQNKEAV